LLVIHARPPRGILPGSLLLESTLAICLLRDAKG
jgi:hypothetical protein